MCMFYNQKELARRWDISHRTLERWRRIGEGPSYLKVGAHILYPRSLVEEFERGLLQKPAAAAATHPNASI